MDIVKVLKVKSLYHYSFTASIVLLPWSNRLCSYSLVAMCLLGLISNSWNEKVVRIKEKPFVLAFLGFYLLYVLGIFYGQHIGDGLVSLEQKLGLVTIPLIAASSIAFSKKQVDQAIRTFVLSCFTITLFFVGLQIYLFYSNGHFIDQNFDPYTRSKIIESSVSYNSIWSSLSYINLANGSIGPTYLSMYLLFCVGFLLRKRTIIKNNSSLTIALLLWFTLIIMALASRIGILIYLIIILLDCGFLLVKRELRKQQVALLITLLLTVTISIFSFPTTKFRLIDEPLSTNLKVPNDSTEWNSVNLRLMEWQAGLEGIKKNVFSGTGTGGTLHTLNLYYSGFNLGEFKRDYNTHNQYLETFLEIGLAGFFLLLICYFIPIRIAVNQKILPLLFLMVIISVSSLTESILETEKGLVFYSCFLSLFMFSTKNYYDETE